MDATYREKLLARMLAVSATLFMTGCATVDRNTAASLGKAGEDATQALSSQTKVASQELKELSEWWGVHDVLVCAKVQTAAFKQDCINNVSSDPAGLDKRVAQLVDVLNKRKQATDTLNHAYAAFVDLADYNAGQQAVSALGTSFNDINAFLKAASALPGAPMLAPISTTIEEATGGAVALISDKRECDQILAANKDLKKATDALYKGLSVESTYMSSLLVVLEDERQQLYMSALDAGLLAPTDILTPVFNQAYPGIHLQDPSKANLLVVIAAAKRALADKNKIALSATKQSYASALDILHAVSAEHDRLTDKKPLRLGQIETTVSDLRADLAPLASTTSGASKK